MKCINLVALVELFSNNSDGTRITLNQQRSWAAEAARSAPSTLAQVPTPHAVGRRLGPEACADVLRRYAAGETAQALAAEYGVARNAILNLLRANSVVVRRQPPSDEQKLRFVDAYESGSTISDVAKRTGFSFGSVQKALHASGTPMRPRGGSRNGR